MQVDRQILHVDKPIIQVGKQILRLLRVVKQESKSDKASLR